MHLISAEFKEESRCYECGKPLIMGGGVSFGDQNPDTKARPRSLCKECIAKAFALISKKQKPQRVRIKLQAKF